MNTKLSKSVKIGIFGLSMVILLYFGINFIKSKKIFSSDNVFYIEYSQANGIVVSSPVLVKGFKVGTVDKVSFDIQRSSVVVKISVDNNYPIPNDSQAKISSSGLLGGPIIEIMLGRSSKPYDDGDYLQATQEQGILAFAGEEYEKLKKEASSIIDQISKMLVGINTILSEENLGSIQNTLQNLNSMSDNLNSVVASQKNNMEGLISNLNSVTAQLNKDMPKLGTTLTNLETLSSSLATDAPTLIANASEAVGQLNEVIGKVNSNDGTLGKLVNDAEIYDNLSNATSALTILLEDIKQNPKRYVNISVFGGKKNK